MPYEEGTQIAPDGKRKPLEEVTKEAGKEHADAVKAAEKMAADGAKQEAEALQAEADAAKAEARDAAKAAK